MLVTNAWSCNKQTMGFSHVVILAPEACSKLWIFSCCDYWYMKLAVNKLWAFLMLWLLTPDACSKQTMGFSHVVTTDAHTCSKQTMGFSHVVTTDAHTCSKTTGFFSCSDQFLKLAAKLWQSFLCCHCCPKCSTPPFFFLVENSGNWGNSDGWE